VPPLAKIKLAGKRKKESHTSRVSWHKEHSNIAYTVMRARRPSKMLCAVGKERGVVAHNCKAQGDMEAHQYHYVLFLPHVIAVKML
jgi:hypothetical protein